jgi:2,3-diketo-5-methylthio-1-phosphopentane phosphatase
MITWYRHVLDLPSTYPLTLS